MAGPRGLSGAAVRRGQGGGLIRELGRAYRNPFPAHSPPGFEQEASSPPHLGFQDPSDQEGGRGVFWPNPEGDPPTTVLCCPAAIGINPSGRGPAKG